MPRPTMLDVIRLLGSSRTRGYGGSGVWHPPRRCFYLGTGVGKGPV
jgi:hypothetical protein